MAFASPFSLLFLLAMPSIWWLLRATPPAPRRQVFPALRLLRDLPMRERTPARAPPWLLALRLLAAALAIVGLAQPVLRPAEPIAGRGPLLLVVDDGWASAADWAVRRAAAETVLAAAERAGRQAALLATAAEDASRPIRVTPLLPAGVQRTALDALQPRPWPVDRAAAARALAAVEAGPGLAVAYVADGLATTPADDNAFAAALARLGPVTELRADTTAQLLRPALRDSGAATDLAARIEQLPRAEPTPLALLAEAGDGRVLGRTEAVLPAGEGGMRLALVLPVELRNRLARLSLEGAPAAGRTLLLDESARRRPIGLAAAGSGADTPLSGALFYLRRALEAGHELREGDPAALLARPISVVVLADPRPAADDRERLDRWVRQGGTLVRFAGPGIGAGDALLPVPLLPDERRMGGALSWDKPAGLAPFPAGSPFAGLPIPNDVAVRRQALAAGGDPAHPAGRGVAVWAALRDGTPLVTAAPRGAGRVVLFHVTANADWSDLPLSGLFPAMLERLVRLAAGVGADGPRTLPPAETEDGFGVLGPPPPGAQALPERVPLPSPTHPPGLYGPAESRRAFNPGDTLPGLRPLAPVAGAARMAIPARAGSERPLGPALLAAGMGLLAADLLAALWLRGLLPTLAMGLALGAAPAARAQPAPAAALQTRLAYVLGPDAAENEAARAGLARLSGLVNQRTAAQLGEPVGVVPGRNDLAFYPLLYWPVTAAPDAREAAALDAYMRHDGMLVADTLGRGPGPLREAGGLDMPKLAPLDARHVLAHDFYLLSRFPGRTDGTVWVAAGPPDESPDDGAETREPDEDVSPVVIGDADWASAWAGDGAADATMADRFGINLVIYALTGNYKGDQAHVPALLERMGR